jgi:hypothetical protein
MHNESVESESWRKRWLSRNLGALGFYVEGVERLAGGHEDTIAFGTAEAEIGADFWKMNFAEQGAVGREDVHAVEGLAGPPRSGPDVAIHIAANTIGYAGRHIGKDPAIFQAHAIFDIVDANGMRLAGVWRFAGVDDVHFSFVGRKTDTVGLDHVTDNDRGLTGFRVDAVNVGGQFEGSFVSFVVGHDAVARIGEPDGSIGMDGEIVWRVELFVLEMIHQHGDGAVVFGAGDAASVVFAGDKAALAIAIVAVAVVRRSAEHADFASVFEPTQHSIVGNIAEEKIAAIGEPDRAFSPARTGVEAFNGGVPGYVFCKSGINDFDGGIGIGDWAFAILLSEKRRRLKRERCCRTGRGMDEGASVHRAPQAGSCCCDALYHHRYGAGMNSLP